MSAVNTVGVALLHIYLPGDAAGIDFALIPTVRNSSGGHDKQHDTIGLFSYKAGYYCCAVHTCMKKTNMRNRTHNFA